MKKFAGIDIQNYDFAALTPEQLHTIKVAFLAHYNYMSAHEAHCAKASLVSKHLMKYLKIENFSACSNEQMLANILGNLPDFPLGGIGQGNYMLIYFLRQALKDCKYQELDLQERKSIIEQRKNTLNFSGDWKKSVNQYKMTASKACLDIAFVYLQDINAITQNVSIENSNYYEYLLGLQIANYISILEFMRAKRNLFVLGKQIEVLDKFCDLVQTHLAKSLQSLHRHLNTEDNVQKAKSSISGLFFKWFVTNKREVEFKPISVRFKNI